MIQSFKFCELFSCGFHFCSIKNRSLLILDILREHTKCEQRIIAEQNAIILLKLRHECHTAISVWARRNLTIGRWFRLFWRKRNRQRNLEENREHWLVTVVSVWTLWTNGFREDIFLLPFCAKFELYFSLFKCEMYITTPRMAERDINAQEQL